MNRAKKIIKRIFSSSKGLIMPVVLLCSLLMFFTAISNLENSSAMTSQQQLEDALRRGAAACFADEGVYPDSVDYLKEHYGVMVDEEKYIVNYDVFAENIMPEITVIKKQ